MVWAAHHSKGFKLRQTLPLSIDPPNPKLRQRAVDDVKAAQHTLRAAVMMRCTDRKPSAKAGRQERRPNFGRIKIACSVAGAHDFIFAMKPSILDDVHSVKFTRKEWYSGTTLTLYSTAHLVAVCGALPWREGRQAVVATVGATLLLEHDNLPDVPLGASLTVISCGLGAVTVGYRSSLVAKVPAQCLCIVPCRVGLQLSEIRDGTRDIS